MGGIEAAERAKRSRLCVSGGTTRMDWVESFLMTTPYSFSCPDEAACRTLEAPDG